MLVQRAGRDGKPATVFSFFTRNLQPLAPDVVQLLQKSKQWVDPNLLSLAETSPKKNQAKSHKKSKNTQNAQEKSVPAKEESDNDSFAALAASRIVLKRSKNVSDTSDEEDDGEDEG